MKFQKVSLTATKIIVDSSGKKKRVQKTFFQTINPFNKNMDKNNPRYGLIKNHNDIYNELKIDIDEWKKNDTK